MIMLILERAGELLKKPIHIDKTNLSEHQVGRTLQTIFNWTMGWLPSDPELAQAMLAQNDMQTRIEILLERMGCSTTENEKKVNKPTYHNDGKIIYVDFAQASAHRDSPHTE